MIKRLFTLKEHYSYNCVHFLKKLNLYQIKIKITFYVDI